MDESSDSGDEVISLNEETQIEPWGENRLEVARQDLQLGHRSSERQEGVNVLIPSIKLSKGNFDKANFGPQTNTQNIHENKIEHATIIHHHHHHNYAEEQQSSSNGVGLQETSRVGGDTPDDTATMSWLVLHSMFHPNKEVSDDTARQFKEQVHGWSEGPSTSGYASRSTRSGLFGTTGTPVPETSSGTRGMESQKKNMASEEILSEAECDAALLALIREYLETSPSDLDRTCTEDLSPHSPQIRVPASTKQKDNDRLCIGSPELASTGTLDSQCSRFRADEAFTKNLRACKASFTIHHMLFRDDHYNYSSFHFSSNDSLESEMLLDKTIVHPPTYNSLVKPGDKIMVAMESLAPESCKFRSEERNILRIDKDFYVKKRRECFSFLLDPLPPDGDVVFRYVIGEKRFLKRDRVNRKADGSDPGPSTNSSQQISIDQNNAFILGKGNHFQNGWSDTSAREQPPAKRKKSQ